MRVTNDDNKPSLVDALEHYGVKGMKWGVRRSAAQLNKARKKRDTRILDARDKLPIAGDRVRGAKKTYKSEKKRSRKEAGIIKARKDAGRKAAKETLKNERKKYGELLEEATKKTSGEVAAKLVLDSTYGERSPRENASFTEKVAVGATVNRAVDDYQRRGR